MLPEPKVPSVMSYPKCSDTKWARMSYWLFPLLIFNFSFLIFQCGLDVEDPTPPSPPVWVQKSLPEEWPERGIDAHESGGIYLEWHSSLRDDIKAYHLLRASVNMDTDSIGEYSQLISIEVGEDSLLDYVDSQIIQNEYYYYKLSSEDKAGNVSDYSDESYYSTLPQVDVNRMRPNGVDDTLSQNRVFWWVYEYNIAMENYCITILNSENELVLRQLFSPTNYVGGWESWQMSLNVELINGQVYKWRIDTGANYVDNHETAGSETGWANFLYVQINSSSRQDF